MTGSVISVTDAPVPVIYRVPPLISVGIAVMFFYLICLAYRASKYHVTAAQTL